jgi:release factor glutamine methyltransferase
VRGLLVKGSLVTGAGAAPPEPLVILDLCCGTGALGLAVAHELGAHELGAQAPGERAGDSARVVDLYAADLDPAAVACARRNVEPVGGRVYQGDLFAAVPAALRHGSGVLICNAPYVPTPELAFMPAEARDHEARVALDGGDDGLAVLRRVAAQAPAWLAPGGVLLVETSERQAPAMAAAMGAAGLVPRVHADDEYGATVVTGQRP